MEEYEYIIDNNNLYDSLSNFSAISEGNTQIPKQYSESGSSNKSTKFYGKDQKEPLYFICEICHSSPMIFFKDNYLLDINCECREIINFSYKEFIEMYSTSDNDIIEEYCYCKIHKKK